MSQFHHYLLLVSTAPDRDDTLEEKMSLLQRFHGLDSEKEKEWISSDRFADLLSSFQTVHNLSDFDSANLTRAIRSFYFEGKVKPLSSYTTLLDPAVLKSLQEKLLIEANNTQITINNAEQSLTLQEITQKFPEVLTEQIGSRPIQYQKTQKSLPPTAKSWVLAYTKTEGVMNHSDLVRGNFVYRSQITRHLTSQEKTKVIELLTAYDRNEPLRIDIEKKKVIWDGTDKLTAPNKNRPATQSNLKQNRQGIKKSLNNVQTKDLKSPLRRKSAAISDDTAQDQSNPGAGIAGEEEALSPYRISPMGIKK